MDQRYFSNYRYLHSRILEDTILRYEEHLLDRERAQTMLLVMSSRFGSSELTYKGVNMFRDAVKDYTLKSYPAVIRTKQSEQASRDEQLLEEFNRRKEELEAASRAFKPVV